VENAGFSSGNGYDGKGGKGWLRIDFHISYCSTMQPLRESFVILSTLADQKL
jgi:hypothetical protein